MWSVVVLMARFKGFTAADASVSVPDEAPPEPLLEAASAFMQRRPHTGAGTGSRSRRAYGRASVITIRYPDPGRQGGSGGGEGPVHD